MDDSITIPLDLRRHCIETEAKKRYNRKVAQYFKDDTQREKLASEIELLKTVLETFDFSRLRSQYPVLAGQSDASVAIELVKPGQLAIIIDTQRIDPFRR
jgi:hypothetical protein